MAINCQVDFWDGLHVVKSQCNFSHFQGTRFQQGNDAVFVAFVTGKPVPEVSWSRKRKELPSSEKYQLEYDPTSGRISLLIRDLGPGDEGQYSCTASNDYGSVTATLSVNPDINNMKHRALSPGCCRASLQRRGRQRVHHHGHDNDQASTADYDYGSGRSASGMTL